MILVAPITRAWQLRELITAILSRELASRFRGSILGWLWAVASPLVIMFAYAIIFSGLFVMAGGGMQGDFRTRALIIFCGVTIFNLFTELLYRAPSLLHEHATFIKKSIFPTEAFAWIAVLRALVYSAISFAVLVVFELAITRTLPPTVLLAPLIIAPMIFLLLGVTWFLMAFGAFTRDISHLMATIVPVLMWVSPVFYRTTDIPAAGRHWMYLNIMADYIEMFRGVMLTGKIPGLVMYFSCSLVSYVVFLAGYEFYTRNKSIIVDVI